LNIVGVVDDDDDVDDDEETDFNDDEDSFFDLLSPVLALLLLVVFLLLPTFMIRLLTAACATDLKSASVGGFDRIGAGVVELVAADFVLILEATVIVFVGTDDVALLLDDKTASACGETPTCGIT
jgi:hypothetical protein